MNAADVIHQLIDLEKAVGKSDPGAIRAMLLRVEEGVLALEQLTIETLRENAALRQRLEERQTRLAPGWPPAAEERVHG
jgi:hypothetical protein